MEDFFWTASVLKDTKEDNMAKAIDITYQTFGMLTAIKRAGTRNGEVMWLCICNCGKEAVVKSDNLRYGRTRSCGCLRRKNAEALPRKVTHGKSRSRLYVAYRGMKDSCYTPSCTNFRKCGACGITVCDEWLNDFQAYYDWAMANGYDENAPRGQSVIYRVDKSKSFSPDNCRVGSLAESRACMAPRKCGGQDDGA